MNINIDELMHRTGVQFGTSGVRGRVVDMTDEVCWVYTTAFLQYLQQQGMIEAGDEIGIAGDLRNSTPRIMTAAATACRDMGFVPRNFGFIPSPAIACYGIEHDLVTIMVTGSHIPEDRNGIKFNTALGEILKPDELGIRSQRVAVPDNKFNQDGSFIGSAELGPVSDLARQHYIARYTQFLSADSLEGLHIGVYQHSAVTRDLLTEILQRLGARVTLLGRSDTFMAVDTEAIRPEDIELACAWAEQDDFDAIVSTDGDGDRPLISDEQGNWLRGDIVGILTARLLGADVVVTPVSSNSAVEKCGWFKQVLKTRIGSPFVIEAMQKAEQNGAERVVGYEANGGFLQQTRIEFNHQTLTPLPTRDAVIVILAVLLSSKQQKWTISQLLQSLPDRYTYSDRLKAFPTELSHSILQQLSSGDQILRAKRFNSLFDALGKAKEFDITDGLRVTLDSGDIVHLRPSGNAPELRCYTESDSREKAISLNQQVMQIMRGWLENPPL